MAVKFASVKRYGGEGAESMMGVFLEMVESAGKREKSGKLSDMKFTKFSDFFTPPPCLHLDLDYTIRFTQLSLLYLLFNDSL